MTDGQGIVCGMCIEMTGEMKEEDQAVCYCQGVVPPFTIDDLYVMPTEAISETM